MGYAAATGAMKRAALALALLAAPACGESGTMTVDTLKRELEAALPLGSSPELVANWVNANRPSSDGPLSPADLHAERERPGVYTMLSIKRDVRRSLFVSSAVQATFTFDADRKLTGIAVRELHTGP